MIISRSRKIVRLHRQPPPSIGIAAAPSLLPVADVAHSPASPVVTPLALNPSPDVEVKADAAPIGVRAGTATPIYVGADAAPVLAGADAAPIHVGADAAPISVRADAAPIPVRADAAPIPVEADAALPRVAVDAAASLRVDVDATPMRPSYDYKVRIMYDKNFRNQYRFISNSTPPTPPPTPSSRLRR